MKKLRINTSLRRDLGSYVEAEIEAGLDRTRLAEAYERLQASTRGLLVPAYPAEDMAILAKYGRAGRYHAFTFRMPEGKSRDIDLAEPLAYDLPDRGRSRFETGVDAEGPLIAAASLVELAKWDLRAECRRQCEQARVLIGCALYFEDVLDYLGVSPTKRVSLAGRWRLPVAEALPDVAAEFDAEGAVESPDEGSSR